MRPGSSSSLVFHAPLAGLLISGQVRSEQADAVIQQRERDAFERGRAEAEKALREQLIQQRADLQSLQSGVLASLRDAVPQFLRASEQSFVALAMETARRLVGGLEITPALIESVVREALSQAENSGRITVLLNPEDLALIDQVHSPLTRQEIAGERIVLQAAPKVGRGGCIIESDFGTLDARREVKFELLRQVVEL
jgi:flagellar biosynthesis/type III secretory pathway protein FliH